MPWKQARPAVTGCMHDDLRLGATCSFLAIAVELLGNMPFWERGSLVTSLIHCGAPKAGCYISLACVTQALIGLVGPLSLLLSVCFEVLLMLWNKDLRWADQPYQFAEIFAGVGNVSKEWSGPHSLQTVRAARKRCGFNVARFDILYGERKGRPTSMNFCTSPGFVC